MPTLINAYATLREVEAPAFPIDNLNRRDRRDPELAPHLDGFAGYVMSLSDEMTSRRYALLNHLARVRHNLSFEVEDVHRHALEDWARRMNAVLFVPDGGVLDPAGRVLTGPEEPDGDADAEIPWPADALARRARIQAELAARGLKSPDGLPPVIGEGEVILRDPRDVALRCMSLLAVAVRGESVNEGAPLPISVLRQRLPMAFKALTPNEQQFLTDGDWLSKLKARLGQTPSADRQAVIDAVWRYEGVALLLWALGRTPELPDATAICDVPGLTKAILAADAGTFVNDARLRPATEILDALDLHYRLHWIVTEARVRGPEPAQPLEPGVVKERHHALNWLTRLDDAEWDDVRTDT